MKSFKSLFKQVFGDHKDGMEYAEQLVKKNKAPLLFVYGDQAQDFASLLTKLTESSHHTSEEEFDSSHSSDIILLKAGKDIKTDTIRKAIKAAHTSQRIIISMDKRPAQLDALYDPMLKVVEASGVDLSKVIPYAVENNSK